MIKHVVALSGGKDSTAMALRLRELFPSRRFEYVLTPTGDELPEMESHWQGLGRLLGPLTRLNGKTLFDLIDEKKMIPNFRARWCTAELKIYPFIDYMDALPSGSTMYVGLRADEDERLGLVRPDATFITRYPMREWGWSIADVFGYLKSKGVKIPDRTDCGACFFQRLPEWRELLQRYPDRFEKYVQVEKNWSHIPLAGSRYMAGGS